MKSSSRAVPLLILLLSGSALAAEAVPTGPPTNTAPATRAPATQAPSIATPAALFAKLDADKDNRVSRPEASVSQKLDAAFERLDLNRDGYLTMTEFAMWEEAGNSAVIAPPDGPTAPTGSRGAQHVPDRS